MINCMPDVEPLLVITRGLPGCGKTTYAKNWVAADPYATRSRLNRDDLRETMHGGAHGYPRELEDAVTIAHRAAVTALLLAGRDVITDDMNLSNKQVKAWMEVARNAGAVFEIVDLTNVELATCWERDRQRGLAGGNSVGKDYITKKYQQFIKGRTYPLPRPQLSEPVDASRAYETPRRLGDFPVPKCILVDIDGTMALMNGREPYDWHRVNEDLPNENVVTLISWLNDNAQTMYEQNGDDLEIIFMSGRDEVCRAETEVWLGQMGFVGHDLYMRPSLPDGVQQPKDSLVKLALFDEHIRDNYNVVAVFDDRDQVVEMWRSIGLTCLQVAPGPF